MNKTTGTKAADTGSRARRWRVGDLAAATGLTVRALHHYEQIGLLAPPSRTEGKQRLYSEREVRRLYRICALRDIGLSLADIARAKDRTSLRDVLRQHLAQVDAEIARLTRLRLLVAHACAQENVGADDLLATIEAMSLVARRGEDRWQRGHSPEIAERWRVLGDELRACMKDGAMPSSRRALAVARKAQAALEDFAGGDPATLDALAHLRRSAPPREELAGWNAEMMRYLDDALTHLQKKEGSR